MQRQNLQQLRPALQTRQDEMIHPSHGIGNPYSQDMRSLVMFMSEHLNDQENPAVRNMVALLCQAHVYPSSQTLTRWESLNDTLGHVRACGRNGGRQPERFAGQDLVFLAVSFDISKM